MSKTSSLEMSTECQADGNWEPDPTSQHTIDTPPPPPRWYACVDGQLNVIVVPLVSL